MIVDAILVPPAVQLLLACGAYPLLEEIVFRSGLLRELDLRFGDAAWRNNIVTSLAFGLCHVPAWGFDSALLVLLPSLALGWLYQRSGRLWLPFAAHAGMNAVRLALAF